MKFHRVELELKTVTPAFIGGSDPATSAEWAAKSVRGHLRWWFRAVMGGELQGDDRAVRLREDAIFGSTDHRSPVKILVRPVAVRRKEDAERAEGGRMSESEIADAWGDQRAAARLTLTRGRTGTNPIGYLGYGPLIWDNHRKDTVYGRARINPGQKLHLLVQWNDSLAPELLEDLKKALCCWLSLGGIGGRSRRGFGSLSCESGDSFAGYPKSLDQFRATFERLLASTREATTAQWSHFTGESRVYVSQSAYRDWTQALSAAGAWLIAFRRRYGIATDERTGVRDRDYAWLRKTAGKRGVPDRAGFGLPLPFGRGEQLVAAWRLGKESSSDDHPETGRRASPLLIHVARFQEDHRLVFTWLPALLVPPLAEIHFQRHHSRPTEDQYGIIPAFLDHLDTKNRITRIL